MGCGSSKQDATNVLAHAESIQEEVLATATSAEPPALAAVDGSLTTMTFGSMPTATATATVTAAVDRSQQGRDDATTVALAPGPSASPLRPVRTPSGGYTSSGKVSRKGSGTAFSSRGSLSRIGSMEQEDRETGKELFRTGSGVSDSSQVGEPPTPGVYLAKVPPPKKTPSLKPLGHPASQAGHRLGPEPLGCAASPNGEGPAGVSHIPSPPPSAPLSAAQTPNSSSRDHKPVSRMSFSGLPPGLQNWEHVGRASGYNNKMMDGSRRVSDLSANGFGGGLSEFGSLTGWQRIAADIMAGMDEQGETEEPAAEPQAQEQSAGRVDHSDQLTRWQTIKTRPGISFYADYEIIQELGAGAYGKAFKCQRILDGEIVVAKQILTENMSMKERLETKQEVKVLAHMDHPNVVKYYAAYAEDKEITIVMEFCEEGDLTRFLKQRKGKLLEEHQIMLRFVQVCLALHHVHEKGILHRDLKSSNIFCDTYSIVKLGDFGISKMMGGETACRTIVGTPYYLSPEICEDKPYGVKSDMWSLGCVLYELCTLKHAFDGKSLPQLVLKILSGKFPPIPNHYSDDLKNLVNSLLCRNPVDRPQLADIFKSGYVREHLHRYVIHIKKHITKRKESFKRSVATWDSNSLTGYSMKDRPGSGQSKNGTIAKRQHSHLDDSMNVSVPRTVTKFPPGSRRHMEMLDTTMDALPPRPKAEENPRHQAAAANLCEAETTTSGSEGDNLNLSQCIGKDGMSLLKLGLPPPQFDGSIGTNAKSSEDGVSKPDSMQTGDGTGTSGSAAGKGVMDLLPASRWSKGSALASHGGTEYASSISQSVTSTRKSTLTEATPRPSDDGTGFWESEGSSSRATEKLLDKQSTIRRLMEAGATAATAAVVADVLAGELGPPFVPEDEPVDGPPHEGNAMGFMLPGSMYSRQASYALSALAPSSHWEGASGVDGDEASGRSRQGEYTRQTSYALSLPDASSHGEGPSVADGDEASGRSRQGEYTRQTSYALSVLAPSSRWEGASVADGDEASERSRQGAAGPTRTPPDTSAPQSRRTSEHVSPAESRPLSASGSAEGGEDTFDVERPQLSIKLVPAGPDRQESLVLKAVGRQDSGAGTPQFRMAGGKPANPAAQQLEAHGSGGTEASLSSPNAAGTLGHWEKSPFARNSSISSDADPEEAGHHPHDSHNAIGSMLSIGGAEMAKGLSRFAQQSSHAEGHFDADQGELPEERLGMEKRDAKQTPTFIRAPTLIRAAQTEGQEFELQIARKEVAKIKTKYEEDKAQRAAEAAARAKQHRQQLLEAKEAKEKARVSAEQQAATWVRMLKSKVQTAKPRVPGRATSRRPTNPSPPVIPSHQSKTQQDQNAQAQSTAQPPQPGDAEQQRSSDSSDLEGFEKDEFFQELAEAGRQAHMMERVYGVLDQVTELMEEPPRPGQLKPMPSLESMTEKDLAQLETRIKELHREAKMHLGLNAFNAVRKYIGANMADSQPEQGPERDTQAELQAIVGEANMAHLPLVLKAVQQEAAYAEAKSALEGARADAQPAGAT